jgi:hypothetical protein
VALVSSSNWEVLFKDQGWVIKGIPGYEDMFDAVYHKCKWKNNFLLQYKHVSIYTMKHGDSCGWCGEKIPDSIMGVWKLKNFDLLEEPQYQQGLSPFYCFNTTPHSTPTQTDFT